MEDCSKFTFRYASSPSSQSTLIDHLGKKNFRPKEGVYRDHGRERGFTIVEVLVVSVIMAILAAVTIPLYSNYVLTQRKAVVKGLAETGAVSANIFLRRNRRPPSSEELRETMFFPDPSRYTVVVEGFRVTVIDVSASPPVQDTARFN